MQKSCLHNPEGFRGQFSILCRNDLHTGTIWGQQPSSREGQARESLGKSHPSGIEVEPPFSTLQQAVGWAFIFYAKSRIVMNFAILWKQEISPGNLYCHLHVTPIYLKVKREHSMNLKEVAAMAEAYVEEGNFLNGQRYHSIRNGRLAGHYKDRPSQKLNQNATCVFPIDRWQPPGGECQALE